MEGTSHPDIACLRRIRSLSQFSDEQLANLAAGLEIETADPGQCLIELGSCEKFSLYLIEGALRAITHDQQETRFVPDDDGELLPIAQIRPSMYRVVADGAVRFFRLYLDQLTDFARHQIEDEPEADIELVEIDETTEQSMFQIQLFKDLLTGDLKLPSLPDVAQRIQQAFADNLVTAETVGVIIQSDPVITAKMIMVANSALYGGRAPIESLQQAVVRLGLENTRKLVMTYVVKELFDSKTSEMRAHMQAVWKHSQHVASLCRLLAERLDGFEVEQAQLAGLVHDIGEVAILQYAQQHDELRDNPEKLLEAVKSMRPQITGMLLEQWNFGPEFVTVGEECEEWFRNPTDQPDLCDLVLIAQYHSMIGTPKQRSLPPIAALPAFAKLGMGNLAIEQVIEFMKKSRDKIKSIEAHLGSL
ncbi:MAG: HDOD domain-containing protein [Gammaproteobacteria bacterium]|nr:HDOD domain-containing protein [Gammaproteobacteria bacterium]